MATKISTKISIEFIHNEHLEIGVLYYAGLHNPGQAAVADGGHAWSIAEQINGIIEQRSGREKSGILHIFAACPSALFFNLGKMSLSYGNMILYEYNFERQGKVTYYKSFALPFEKI